uniref:uncharacterized protein n=1 Tax=Myxine glutinosa TaxID=7769 RepID=UPI0035902733
MYAEKDNDCTFSSEEEDPCFMLCTTLSDLAAHVLEFFCRQCSHAEQRQEAHRKSKGTTSKVPPKKKRSDAYFDPIDCSEPRRKENQNGEEEELTTEAKGETAEEPDVMKDTESWRENERQATSDSTTALNSVLERAESSAMEMSWFKLRSPQQATLMQSPEASGDLMRDDQWHKELLLAKLRALDEGKDVERNSPSPTLKDIARPSLVMQNSNKDRFERMMMMKDGPLIFSPPQTSHLKKEVVGEMNVQGMPEQEFGEH